MKRAFAVAAHPDDIEFFMAGTLILLRDAGYEIHYMNVANGCCGSTTIGKEDLITMRREEGRAAAALVGAHFHESLCDDLGVFYEPKTLARLAAVMREVAPEILLVHADRDYMEDHMNSARLAVTAAFAREMPNFATDPPRPPVSQPVTIYHAQPYPNTDPLRQPVRAEFYVDISSVLQTKHDMLAKHRSQKEWLDQSQGVDSYLHMMKELGRDVGKLSGCYEYAEGWRRHLHAGFCAPDADPVREALSKFTTK